MVPDFSLQAGGVHQFSDDFFRAMLYHEPSLLGTNTDPHLYRG